MAFYLLLVLLLLREEDIAHRYVDLGNAQAHQVLYPVHHVAANGFGELGYRLAVLGGHRKVYGRFFFTDLDGHAAGLGATAATAAAR